MPTCKFSAVQEEFGNLNPLIPSHYYFLLKKSMTAIKDNNFKVASSTVLAVASAFTSHLTQFS